MKKVFGILQGDQAPRIIELWLPNVPGEYAVYAALRGASGHERAVTRKSATVLPQFGH